MSDKQTGRSGLWPLYLSVNVLIFFQALNLHSWSGYHLDPLEERLIDLQVQNEFAFRDRFAVDLVERVCGPYEKAAQKATWENPKFDDILDKSIACGEEITHTEDAFGWARER